MAGKLRVRLVKSPIGCPGKAKAWVAGLGLKRPNQEKVLADTPAVRGMLAKVPHMVEVTAVEEKKVARKRVARPAADAGAQSPAQKEN
jgi:large subunit ribosomal protein L30